MRAYMQPVKVVQLGPAQSQFLPAKESPAVVGTTYRQIFIDQGRSMPNAGV